MSLGKYTLKVGGRVGPKKYRVSGLVRVKACIFYWHKGEINFQDVTKKSFVIIFTPARRVIWGSVERSGKEFYGACKRGKKRE